VQGIAVLLFLLGVLFIYVGWRVESKPSRELYAVLVGLSKVKKEVFRLEKDFKTLEEKVDQSQKNHEEVKAEFYALRQAYDETNQHNETYLHDEPNIIEELNNPKKRFNESVTNQNLVKHEISVSETNVYSLNWIRERGSRQREISSSRIVPERVSEKYSMVIDLSRKGMPVAKVAEELAMSQDAVNMVLRTYQIGGRR